MTTTVDNLDKDREVIVDDISDVEIGYVLSSNGTVRRFTPGVRYRIPASELRELSYQRGGLYLLQNYLRVHDKDLAEEFGIPEDTYEHEYQWTRDDVDKCLKEDDLDVLLDALDFAPEGVIESLKDRAIALEIPDTRKLKAIGQKTDSDIEAMIRNKHAYDNPDEGNEDKAPKQRRVASKAPQRRRRAS